MKRLLASSLALNALLLGLAWWRNGLDTEAPVPRPLRGDVGVPASGGGARMTHLVPASQSAPTPWAGIESPDPRQLMANLRAIGCPEATIRDLVVFRIGGKYRALMLADAAQAAQAWDYTKNQEQKTWRERNARRNELRDAMNQEIEDLLGEGIGAYRATVLGWGEPPTDYLALEKRQQVQKLETRYRSLAEELESDRMAGWLGTEGAAQLKALNREKQAELARLLSPSEVEEYLCRESSASRFVLQRLPQAKSEEEFRAIVRLAAEFDLDPNIGNDALSRYGQEPADPALAKAEAEWQAEFDRRLKALLGEERVAEREAEAQAAAERERQREEQRAETEARAMLTEAAVAAGASEQEAARFFDRMKELEPALKEKFDALEQGLTGTPQENQQQMEAVVRAELERHAVEIMGDRGRDFVRKLAEREK